MFKKLGKMLLILLVIIWGIGTIPLGGIMWVPAGIVAITKI